jgi:hypothetical protein
METSRRAYLLTGDQASLEAGTQADLEDQLARAQYSYARTQDRTLRPPRPWPSGPP